MLYQHLDTASAGFVPTDDCMALLRAPLSPRRAACVRHAYATLLQQVQQQHQQEQHQGESPVTVLLHAQDLLSRFNGKRHPEVVAGRATSEQVYAELADRFCGGTEPTVIISLAEFEAFYCDLGAAIASDDYFELLVRSCWSLPSSSGHSGAAAGAAAGARAPVNTPYTTLYGSAAVTTAVSASAAAAAAERARADAQYAAQQLGSPCRHTYHKRMPQPLGLTDQLADRLLPPATPLTTDDFQFAEHSGSSAGDSGDSSSTAAAAAVAAAKKGAKPEHAAGQAASGGRSAGSTALRAEMLARNSRSQISFGVPSTTTSTTAAVNANGAAATASNVGQRRGSEGGSRKHVNPHVRPYEDHLGTMAAPFVTGPADEQQRQQQQQQQRNSGSASTRSLAEVAAAAAAARQQQYSGLGNNNNNSSNNGGVASYESQQQQQQQQWCDRNSSSGAVEDYSGDSVRAGSDWPLVTGRKHFGSWQGTAGSVMFHRPDGVTNGVSPPPVPGKKFAAISPTWTSSIVLG
jgi:hypothetical protein